MLNVDISGFQIHGDVMLVLTRYPKQKIYIGDDIAITIVEVKGNKVKIGIEAPKEVNIIRDDAKNTQPSKIQQ